MKNDLFNLEQETAVVIGGTGTLGGAMAEALAAAGARVAVVGRNEGRGQERVQSIQSAGGRALFQMADALDRDSLLRARDAIAKKWGTISVLVNGAGQSVAIFHSHVPSPADVTDPALGPRFVCDVDPLLLCPGTYRVTVRLVLAGETQDYVSRILSISGLK